MTEDAAETIQAIRQAVGKAELALANVSELTGPLAKRSNSIAVRLDNSIGSLETLLKELALFSKSINGESGSLALLAKDPQLYRNLTEAAQSLQLIMRNLEPAMKDLRIFADKIARHPEKLGVDGMVHPDSGIKEARRPQGGP
jgi:phospholipid/cholesterol/gamma-HCH transport system substrate-binding protein